MRPVLGRFSPAIVMQGVAACVPVAALAVLVLNPPRDGTSWLTLAVFLAAMVVGELWSVSMLGVREVPPLASAAALGCVMSSQGPDGAMIRYDAPIVILTVVVAMAIGVGVRGLRVVPLALPELAARIIGIAPTVALYRWLPLDRGRPVGEDERLLVEHRWVGALVMLLIALISLAIEMVLSSLLRASRDQAPLWRSFADEVYDVAPLLLAIGTSAVLIAQAEPFLGALAIPLFLIPLALMQLALRRNAATRVASEQSIRALSKITDISGFTRAGHAEAVARLAVQVGRGLGMSARELVDLEYAALLHDLGQVRLRSPIPDGATVSLAPADQQRIAVEGAGIVRRTDALPRVATILESQASPYHQVRELGEPLPLPSRIIKVINAYEDMTAGRSNAQVQDAALERITLGLGYEYDPDVVDILTAVLARTGAGTAPVRRAS